jgi:hypothetical protein
MPFKKVLLIFALTAIIILLCSDNAEGFQAAVKPNSKLVLRDGLDCFYNSDYACAEKKFDEYIKLEPNDPVGYWRSVLNYYFWLRFKQKVDSPKLDAVSYKELIDLISNGIQKAYLQFRAAKGETAGFYLAVQSSLHSVESLLERGNGASSGAVKSFLKSADEADRAAESGSPYGIYLFGMMHYQIGKRPWYDRWPMDVASGLRFQRGKGIEMMFSVPFKVQPEFAPDVWLYLFRIAAEEVDMKETKSGLTPGIKKEIEEFAAKYPGNEYIYNHSLRGTTNRKR